MRPLFHPSTLKALAQFFESDQHAAVVASTSLEGGEALLNDAVAAAKSTAVIIPVQPDDKRITIEQIRGLKASFSLRQVGEQQRIIAIWHAEKMTAEAQNSFLKLLEEPPEGVKILMFTSELAALLPTIRSRVWHLRIHNILLDAALNHYTPAGTSEAEVRRCYAITDGQPNSLFALLTADNPYNDAIDQAKEILRLPVYDRLLLVDQLSKDKEAALLLLAALGDVLRAVSRGAAKQASAQTTQLAAKRRIVLDAKISLGHNVNAKLLLSDVFLSL